MSSEFAIEASCLSKHYPVVGSPARLMLRLLIGRRSSSDKSFDALENVSFSVRSGETMGIIGRNGAGKSTLLQIICGTLTASSGTVKVRGRVAALLELGAGFNPDFTGRENVYMNAAIHGFERTEVDRRMDSILDFAGIGEFIDQPVKTYSSGMFVRLAFAVIAHLDADILVIDEALAVGDVYFAQKCMRFLREFAKTRTLLFVSHDTNSVVNLCQRAVWLEKGKVRMQGSARDVCDAYLGSYYEDKLNAGKDDVKTEPDSQDNASAGSPPAENTREFGLGEAKIVSCALLTEAGEPLHVMDKAQRVTLQVDCVAYQLINNPILGFYIKDRLGQPLCGNNTIGLVADWRQMEEKSNWKVEVSFALPLLATGHYTISVALAAGTQESHVQQHWIHDALAFKSQADPHLTGLFTLSSLECSAIQYDTI